MKSKFIIGLIAVILGITGIVLVLASENALVVHPQGIIAKSQLELILINFVLMLLIIIPTYILLFWVVWKFCIQNDHTKYDPEHNFGVKGEILMWGLPTIIVIIMGFITWERTYALNPYKPIVSDAPPLTVQVVAIDWKWLFIYPDQGIATLNFMQIPEKRPIHLNLTADNSPMNSFWIPELSGQIYSMTGMTTQLFLMADQTGDFRGRAVEINGEGYADMTFSVRASSQEEFDAWVKEVKKSPLRLTQEAYEELVKPTINSSKVLFSDVKKDLFQEIIHKYMYPPQSVIWKTPFSEN